MNPLLQAHLDRAGVTWDRAFARIQNLVKTSSAKQRDLICRLLSLKQYQLHCMFGCDKANLHGYPWNITDDPCTAMESVAQFVSYEIGDDGEPGVGYWKYDWMDGPVPCLPDEEGAAPYFHRNLDLLREFDPTAKYVSVDTALEVLDWHKAELEQVCRRRQEELELDRANGFEPTQDEIDHAHDTGLDPAKVELVKLILAI